MALEQTINADSKNRLKGIIGYADISSAVNRWITTNSMRSEIVNNIVRSSNNLKNATFSSFARSILTKLLKCTKYPIDLCFDVYESPSVKDVKRKARGDNEVDCYFTFGPKQSLLSDFEALQISEYKSQFLRFLMEIRR